MPPTQIELNVFTARNELKKLRYTQTGDRATSDMLYYEVLMENFGVTSMKELKTDQQRMQLADLLNQKIQFLRDQDKEE